MPTRRRIPRESLVNTPQAEDTVPAADQKENNQREASDKRRKAGLLAVVFLVLIAVSATVSLYLLRQPAPQQEAIIMEDTPVPFDADMPFSLQDITATQLVELKKSGRLKLSDGPRNISVGDSIDKVLASYPNNYYGEQPDDEQILYCASYFANANGIMTVLPPRGILRDNGMNIVITLLSPTAPYPTGTADDYLRYEHVYCQYVIDQNTMCVSTIVLGLER